MCTPDTCQALQPSVTVELILIDSILLYFANFERGGPIPPGLLAVF